MTEFKIGDKVKSQEGKYSNSYETTVTKIIGNNVYGYYYRDGVREKYEGSLPASSLELVSSVNESMALSVLAKKLLDKQTRKTIKAGWIDGNLEPTAEGIKLFASLFFLEHKEEIGKLAEKKVKANKNK